MDRLQTSSDIKSYDEFTFASSTQELNGVAYDFLHISGVRSDDKDVKLLCDKAFKQITGEGTPTQSQKFQNLWKKKTAKVQKGFRYIPIH